MSTSTPNGRPLSSKKRSGPNFLNTRKRTRPSSSNQESVSSETLSLRGGRGSFAPAAGIWQRETASGNRLFNNLGRTPLNATLGIPAPARPESQTPAAQGQNPTGTQTGPTGLAHETSQAAQGDRGIVASRPNPVADTTPSRQRNTIGHSPSPGRAPGAELGVGMDGNDTGGNAPPNGPGPESDWGYPDPRWNTDRQIIDGWKVLEALIASYVNDVIVDSIPDIETTHHVYPFETFFRFSDLAIAMVRNERYAKYVFQLSIWNILSVKFLSHMATEWACEEKETHPWGQRTKGLAAAMDLLTHGHSMDQRSTILKREREKWYMWRKDTVDVVFGWLSKNEEYEQIVDNAIFDILTMYQGQIKPIFAGGDRESWDNLVWRTTEVVTFAARLSIMMRRSQDGTWSPFIPVRDHIVIPEAMMRHQDTDWSLPPGQTEISADSKSTMTVVPGLSKYEMINVDIDPAFPDEQNTTIRKMVRMKAKCLIDITEAQTGPRRDGDTWIPDDL